MTLRWLATLWLSITCLGCSASMSAGELAAAIGEATIVEEDEILATCRSLSAGRAQRAKDTPDDKYQALSALVEKDRQGRAKMLLESAGIGGLDDATVGKLLACSEAAAGADCSSVVAQLSPKLQAGNAAVLAVIGFTLEGKTRAEAEQLARQRLLSSLSLLTERFNFSHATVLGLVQVAQLVEGMVDDISDSFGYFKSFASPLLARVSAELIAVGMDGILEELEKKGAVSAASVAQHSCTIYQRIDPASQVTNRVIRRAILRFSLKGYGQSSGMTAACQELSKKKGGDPVCKQILEDEVGAAPRSSGEGEADLERLLAPLLNLAIPVVAPSSEQRRALEVASESCLNDEQRQGPCTIDRVARVASVLSGLKQLEGETGAHFAALESRIDRFEESLSLLHNKMDVMTGRLDALEARNVALGSSSEQLRIDIGAVRDKVASSESNILGALGQKPKTTCRDHVQKVMKARNDLARELGVAAIDPCPLTGGSGSSTIRVYPTKFEGVSVRHEELCDQRFVSVSAQIGFDQGAFECQGGCLDKQFREFSVAKLSKPGAGLVLIGNADSTPIVWKKRLRDAWKAKKEAPENTSLLPEIPVSTDSDQELQRILSMLRAVSVRDELKSSGAGIVLESLGKSSNRRGVDLRFVLPDLTLDLASNCSQ